MPIPRQLAKIGVRKDRFYFVEKGSFLYWANTLQRRLEGLVDAEEGVVVPEDIEGDAAGKHGPGGKEDGSKYYKNERIKLHKRIYPA